MLETKLDAIGQVLVLSVCIFNLSPFSIGLRVLLTTFKKVSMIVALFAFPCLTLI